MSRTDGSDVLGASFLEKCEKYPTFAIEKCETNVIRYGNNSR